jgi:glutathione peroxidase
MLRASRTALPFLGLFFMTSTVSALSPESNIFKQSVKGMDGTEVPLSKYEGKVLLIVNVASKCGLTNQYTQLQAVYEKYKDKGLVVLGFPCNQFGGQEPGTNAEIQQFCSSNYRVTFDLFDKINVNGDQASPLYKQLTSIGAAPKGTGNVSWNFEKFVVDRKGNIVGRFDPKITPENKDLVALIEKSLAQ